MALSIKEGPVKCAIVWDKSWVILRFHCRVSVQGVKSLGGHFACICREFDFYEVKKKILLEKGNTFTLLIIFIVKSLQKEQNSTNLLHTMTPNLPE